MPTPFYHLSLAEDLVNHPDLPQPLLQFLSAWQAEFLFGNTAPDVQVVSGQRRVDTHFFDLPIQPNDLLPWELIQQRYPKLERSRNKPAAQAAFFAGYLCHLQADWLWVKDIFSKVFGLHSTWGSFPQRLYYHNVLRAYLDRQIFPGLPAGIGTCLGRVTPSGWLPFTQDKYLLNWRDLLTSQLTPGAATQTVEVFSARQGIEAPEFYALLSSEDRMQQEIFSHLPLWRVQDYHQMVIRENIGLLARYLAPGWQPENPSITGRVLNGVRP